LCVGLLIKGVYNGSDTKAFLSEGQVFIEGILLGNHAIGEVVDSRLFPSYVISSMILSGIYAYSDLGAIGVITTNMLLFSLTVCMVFHTCLSLDPLRDIRLSKTAAVVLIVGGFYIVFGLPDVFLWSYAVLTDIIFLAWVMFAVFCITKGFLEKRRAMWILAFLACAAAPLVRPTGILLPLLFLYAVLLYSMRRKSSCFQCVAISSIVVPTLATFLLFPWAALNLSQDPSFAGAWLPEVIREFLVQSVHFLEKGTIVATRLEVEPAGPLSYTDIVRSIVYRLLYYWIPIRFGDPPYSDMHNIVNGIYMVVTLPLCFAGARHLGAKAGDHQYMVLFLVMVAYLFALLHGVTLVSFDWRYQVPAMVPYWIIAGCGLTRVVSAIRARTS